MLSLPNINSFGGWFFFHIINFERAFTEDKLQWNEGEFITLPADWEEDFWDEAHPLSSSSSFSISSMSEETDEDREVIVAHQVRISMIPVEELHVGCIVAIRPDPTYYEEHPDEFVAPFWIAKIKGIKKVHNKYWYKVGWFFNDWAEEENRIPQYSYYPELTNNICYSTILHHRIELTPARKLAVHDVRKINRMLEQAQ